MQHRLPRREKQGYHHFFQFLIRKQIIPAHYAFPFSKESYPAYSIIPFVLSHSSTSSGSIKSISTVKTANARILFIVSFLPSLHFSAQNFLMWEYLRFSSIHNRRQKPKSPSLQYIPQIRLPHSAQNQKTQTAA